MTVKVGLLGFGTVASGVPFLLKENAEKIKQAAQDEIEISKVLVKDDAEKERLLAMTPGSYTGMAAELARRV